MKNFLFLVAFLSLFILSSADSSSHKCQITDDCPDLNECVAGICVRKPLFPITVREVFGTIIILSLNALLTAGGVGAAAAYLPYVAVLFGMTIQQAVYIGYTCVFGGGVGNIINIIKLKNKKTNRFMTNYNINMIVLPALMVGIMIGLILNRMFPPMVVNIVLLLVLIYSTTKNYYKLKANLEKEKKEKQMIQPEPKPAEKPQVQAIENPPEPKKSEEAEKRGQKRVSINNESQIPIQSGDTSMLGNATFLQDSSRIMITGQIQNNEQEASTIKQDESFAAKPETAPQKDDNSVIIENKATSNVEAVNVSVVPVEHREASSNVEDIKTKKRELLYQKEQKFPFHKLRELLLNVVIILLFSLIRGTKVFKPIVGVDWTCGWDFLWFALSITAYTILLIRNIYLVRKWQKEKIEVDYEFLPEEPILDKSKIIKLIIVAIIAGIIGALVALGGSMIVGPTLLDFKIPPAFSAATTSLFMIFSMFNAMFQTILNGKLSGAELAWFLSLSVVFSLSSSMIVNWYIKKTGKQSTIMILIITVAVLGFICLLVLAIKGLVEDLDNQITFHPVC